MIRTVMVIALVLGTIATAHAQPLPMPPTPDAAPDPSWWAAFMAFVHQLQGDLYRALAKAVRAVREEGSLAATGWLLALSFFYGVVHAAGPGHGKAVINAYLLGNDSAIRRGILLSFLSAAAQGVTAISLVGILAALLGFMNREVADVSGVLEQASNVMIIAIGVFLVVQTVRSIVAGRDLHAHGHAHHDHSHAHVHESGHAHEHGHDHTYIAPVDAPNWRRGVAVVAAVGLRPCMGSVIVLLFALAQGVFFFGMLATAAISLGTAITVATLAVLASGARQFALKVAAVDGFLLWLYWGLSLAGGLALIVIGVLFLIEPGPPPMPGAG
jgi:nickel/cobalt transporter (NicO) family protein